MTASLTKDLRSALLMLAFFTFLCGLAYPLAMTGAAEAVFPHRAHGSLIERDGEVVGSELIGQQFTAPQYFHSRPSAAGAGYDASSSSGSNLGPTSAALVERVKIDLADVREENGLASDALVPVDAVTASGSGLDPHISPAYARLQAERVAKARDLSEAEVIQLIKQHTESGLPPFGQPQVNVLELNLALDALGAH